MTRHKVSIDADLKYPRWEILRANIEYQQEGIDKEEMKPIEYQNRELIRYKLTQIYKHKQELKRYNHIFN
jgi:hypothetical protein